MQIRDLYRKLSKQWGWTQSHLRVTHWLARELTALLQWRLVAIGCRGILALLCKFAAAGILYLFVGALADEQSPVVAIPYLGWELPLKKFFFAGVVCGTVLMMFATAMQFGIRRAAARAAATFEERCMRRVLSYVSHLPHPAVRIEGRLADQSDVLPMLAYVRSCNFIARFAVQLTPSMISLAAGLVFLFILDSGTTLAITAGFLLIIVLQYPMTNRAARASVASPKNRKAAMVDVQSFVKRLGQTSSTIDPKHSSLNDLFAKKGAFARDLSTFRRRIDSALQADMITRLGNHVILAILFLYVGMAILSGEKSWASVALYVAVARTAVKDFQISGKLLSQIGRFFDQAERFMQFVKLIETTNEYQTSTRPISLPLDDERGERVELLLEPNRFYYCWAPKSVQPHLKRIFVETTLRRAPFWAEPRMFQPELPIRVNLGLPPKFEQKPLIDLLQRLLPDRDISGWPDNWLDGTVANLPNADEATILLLNMAYAERSKQNGILIAASDYERLSADQQAACRNYLQSLPIILVLKANTKPDNLSDWPIILADDQRLAKLADKSSFKVMTANMAKSAPVRASASTSDFDMMLE